MSIPRQINFQIEGLSRTDITFVPEVLGLEYMGSRSIVHAGDLELRRWTGGHIDQFCIANNLWFHFTPVCRLRYFLPSVQNNGKCDTTFRRRIIISPSYTPTAAVPYVELETPGGWFQSGSDTLSIDGILKDTLWEWGIA